MTENTLSPLNNVIAIDDERIKNHLDRVVRGSVEETLNALLDAEADRLCNAQRYERSEARRDTRAGHYERKLQTKAGEVKLRIPKLRAQTFATAIIERYRRRESSVEEALIEMHLAGVSVRRVEDITEALWGTRVSPSTVSELNKKIYGTIEAWRNRPIEGEHPYVYLDGIVLKRSWAGEVRNVSLLVAIGVNGEGYREILGICEGAKEDKAGWSGFLKHLKERGLKGVRLIISDACMGLAESAAEFFPDAAWQRCVVHWYRNIFSHVPSTKVREIAAMLKAIHAGEDVAAARQKAVQVIEKLRGMRLAKAAELVEAGVEQTLAYYAFPEEHWRRVRTTDEIDKRFFVKSGDCTRPFFCSAARQPILPSRPSISEPPRAGAVKAGPGCGHHWLGLDRPEHGGTLARTGPFFAYLELAISGDYGCWARATSWRSVARRLKASPDRPIMSCRAEAPARRFLAVAVSIAPRSARNCAPLGRQPASHGRATP
jgi:putative transposase